jgi:hypothetical protein
MRFVQRFMFTATIAAALSASPASAQEVSVAGSTGPVEILRGSADRWVPLTTQRELQTNDVIRTGTGGTTRLAFPDGSVVVLGSGSLMRLEQLGRREGRSRILLRLLGGQVRATVSSDFDPRGRFEVETPTAVVSVHATQFIVTYNPETAESEVICIDGSVEVSGVLGVLGKPVVLGAGEGTIVRKGAFPAEPVAVPTERIAAFVESEETGVRYDDGLMASFTGADTTAVLNPPAAPEPEAAPGPRRSVRRAYTVISKDAEIIDQSIQEYTLTPPGQTPPGEVSVIIRP